MKFVVPTFAALALGSLALAPSDALSQDIDAALYGWTAGDAAAQLGADATRVPDGRGAIFVPSMSDSQDEPEVIVRSGDEQVASGRTGQRIVLSPGTYSVGVGSGSLNQLNTTSVDVVAGETVTVDSNWGGLVIEVVDQNNIPHRAGYELIRTDNRELFGIGYGADTLQGERLQTWLVPPGLYRVVRPGLNYRAREDFATVYVPEGGLVHFKLVIDPTSGAFRGSGVVPAAELGIYEGGSNWTRSIVIGVDGSLTNNNNVIGQPNQLSISGDVFVDIYATYNNDPHLFSTIVEVEEGLVYISPEQGDPLPIQKASDRIRTDFLYSYFLTPRVGPYVRVGSVGNAFPTYGLTTVDAVIEYTDTDGTVRTENAAANTLFQTGDWFGAQEIREGAGMNFRLLRHRVATMDLRLGAGLRQHLFNDQYLNEDDLLTPEIEFTQLDSFYDEGIEATYRATLRLTRYLHFTTDAELFAPFDDIVDPSVDWQNNLSVRLTRFVSIDYNFDLVRQPRVTQDLQTTHSVLLRLAFEVL